MMNLDPLSAIDLRDLSEAELKTLHLEAIKRRIPLSHLLGQFVKEATNSIIENAEKLAARHQQKAA